MANHSRKPAWANDPGVVWAHCRRRGCRPYRPSKADPQMCERCADELVRYGRRFYARCDHWAPDDGTRRERCPACWQTAQRARKAAANAAWRKQHPEKAQRDQARKRARYATDTAYRERELARARQRWAARHAINPAIHRARAARWRKRNAAQVAQSQAEYWRRRGYALSRLRALQAVRGER